MEGKRLFYTTKMCDATDCANNHTSKIKQIENRIIALFDSQLSDNNILPQPTCLENYTHIQYVDINGTIHIRPRGTETQVLSDIVNFRALTVFPSLRSFLPLEANIGCLLEAYNNHLIK